MKRRFDKMHGLGNDFVIVDAREEPFDVTPARACAIAPAACSGWADARARQRTVAATLVVSVGRQCLPG